MRLSLKAALLSAFVLPGSGHFLLRKYVGGALLAGTTVLCLWVLLSHVLEKAGEISLKIQSGEIPLDMTRIVEEISNPAVGGGTQLTDIATYVLVICWLVGIADSYRIGRLRDKGGPARDKQR
ncbi:MAG: hypothetical protein OEO18_16125 [Gammaproteobacteria bacterium]|nr:hypothetical protein [Gammaproteobacteria bacterium]